MKINKKLLIILSILFLIILAGLIFIPFNKKGQLELPVHDSYFFRKAFFEEAFEQGKKQVKILDTRVYGGIIPHHLIVKDKIAAFFQGIKGYDYETIILIGPNHFFKGRSNIMTSGAKWNTPYGFLNPDLYLINELDINIEEDPFTTEHSISGLVGFIKKTFPEAKFVPIILKLTTSVGESKKLAENIFNNVDKEKVLILASVDFSHYQPVAVADFHDLKSNSAIKSFDFDRIYDLEIDSHASIYTLLKYLELQKTQKGDLIFSTNSAAMIGKEDEPSTSHNFFYFTQGEKGENKVIDFLFFGDVMLDRNVKTLINEKGLDYIFSKLSGEENRFFQGIDIVSANLEGVVTNKGEHYLPEAVIDFAFDPIIVNDLKKYNFNFFNLANNHLWDQGEKGLFETRKNLTEMGFNYVGSPDSRIDNNSFKIIKLAGKKIGMIGLSMVYSDINLIETKKIIGNVKNVTDFVIANIHWGQEYTHLFNDKQKQVAHSLIDAGTDIIIGHHPHVVQGIEIYKNKLIFYSLGNFVFDQYFSKDVQEGLSVGLSIDDESINIFLYPFNSISGQIELMKGDKKERFLEELISWSFNIVLEQIKNSRIKL